jgi:putative intracellular protease/amidase
MKKYHFALLASLLIMTACGSQKKQEAVQSATPAAAPKPVAVVFAPIEFDETALNRVEKQLNQKQVAYDLISIQTGKFAGQDGKEVEVKKASWEVKPDDYRAVVFIGGVGMLAIAKDDTLTLMAQQFAKAGKKLAAFGEGNEVLREAGVLAGQGQETASTTDLAITDSGANIEQVIDSLTE